MTRQYRVVKDYYENGVKYFYIEVKGWFFWTRLVDRYEETYDGMGFPIQSPIYKGYPDLYAAVDSVRVLIKGDKEKKESSIVWDSENGYN